MWLFIAFVVAVAFVFWVAASRDQKKPEVKVSVNSSKGNSVTIDIVNNRVSIQQAYQFSPVTGLVRDAEGNEVIEILWPETFQVIDQAIGVGDYDFARTWLQKFAYSTVRPEVPQFVRDRFKVLMTAFAEVDPLYKQVIDVLLPVIKNQPGILQSKIYEYAPTYNQEAIRYALYFAHELGDLERQKHGRSYKLLPIS